MKAEEFIAKIVCDEKAIATMSLALGSENIGWVKKDMHAHLKDIVGCTVADLLVDRIIGSITDESINAAKEVIEKLKSGTL